MNVRTTAVSGERWHRWHMWLTVHVYDVVRVVKAPAREYYCTECTDAGTHHASNDSSWVTEAGQPGTVPRPALI